MIDTDSYVFAVCFWTCVVIAAFVVWYVYSVFQYRRRAEDRMIDAAEWIEDGEDLDDWLDAYAVAKSDRRKAWRWGLDSIEYYLHQRHFSKLSKQVLASTRKRQMKNADALLRERDEK